MHTQTIEIKKQTWELLPEKAVYWRDCATLIVTDLHLGKSGHFRKSGIAAPSQINLVNLEKLSNLINRYRPERLLILGDLFHSDANREWFQFEEWREEFKSMQIDLVAGNHDRLHESFYKSAKLDVYQLLDENGFRFTHEPEKSETAELLNVSGHVHPAVKVSGKGRQSLRLPCFWFSHNSVILPAFGVFTGLHSMKYTDQDKIYVVADGQVVQFQ